MQSEVALPAALPVAAERVPDVTIRYGEVPPELPDAKASGPHWQMAGGRFLVRIAGVARFLLTDGRDIVVEPVSEASKADVPIFALGTVFGMLQHQRARIVLHASAIAVNEAAVLFCGRSGAGKSTLAAALAQRGYPIISDDVCAISILADGRPVVHADGRKLKLWSQEIERLGLGGRRGDRVRRDVDKFYVDAAHSFDGPVAIAAIYGLEDAALPRAAGIRRSNPVDAALIFRRHAYRPRLVRRLQQTPIYFAAAAAIATATAVFTLGRVRDRAQLPTLVDALEQHWRDLDLKAAAAATTAGAATDR